MTWTDHAPTVEGYYWYQAPYTYPRVLYVTAFHVQELGQSGYFQRPGTGRWIGPLPVPDYGTIARGN